ncbi:uncharacterized protein LOC128579003 isoform X2 [Nycticebus coucang]|uniref:uncharacterized protein LOC128579003 isoform X2 n=1 Tax=Nycticebus coucang TaxID=9470 RepID=UPI00234C7690|nr:uncharacterized protein LOC128579003 isoform X2 [Nycticebus coucang]
MTRPVLVSPPRTGLADSDWGSFPARGGAFFATSWGCPLAAWGPPTHTPSPARCRTSARATFVSSRRSRGAGGFSARTSLRGQPAPSPTRALGPSLEWQRRAGRRRCLPGGGTVEGEAVAAGSSLARGRRRSRGRRFLPRLPPVPADTGRGHSTRCFSVIQKSLSYDIGFAAVHCPPCVLSICLLGF